MPSTYTDRNRLEKQAPGENSNTWGERLNDNVIGLVEDALDGVASFSLSGPKTLSFSEAAADEARMRVLNVTGGTGGTVTIPNKQKFYIVRNGSSGNVVVSTGAGTNATVTAGNMQLVFCDGDNVVRSNSIANFGAANFSTTGSAQASNFRDGYSDRNCQLGNGGIDGAGISAGIPGNNYPAIGHNVRFSESSSVNLVAPLADSACLIQFANGRLEFHSWASGLPGRTIIVGATSLVFWVNSDGLLIAEGSYSTTTATAANVAIDSSGVMRRSTSIRSAKENIRQMLNAEADKVLLLPSRTYTSRSSGDDPNEVHHGFVADEVEAILPALVSRNLQGEADGVRYERVVVSLVDVVRRLEARVAALEAA